MNPDGLGQYLGLKPGDRLIKINGSKVLDVLDYQFRIVDESPILEFEINGKLDVVEVDKDIDENLDVEFEPMAMRHCANDCLFCFVDQNPDGMRDGLYFRDGDYRFSFLYGHYITMTNMGWKEMGRVVEQRMTPLYISVHATDPDLRKELLLYKKDDFLMEKLRYLADNDIEMHTQIVLCPTYNDGDQLRRTLKDLLTITPGVKSIAIVPVGLTGHREGLVQMPPVTREYAQRFLTEYEEMEGQYRVDGARLVVLSDEWYIRVGRELPQADYYGTLAIEENGVGQGRMFLDKFELEQSSLPGSMPHPTKFTIATGVLASTLFEKTIIPRLNEIENLIVELRTIRNTLYGDPVTVTGLLSGKSFIEQLGDKDLGVAIWTTDRILNDAGDLTLDDMTLEQITEAVGVPFNISGDSLLEIFERGILG